MSDIKHLSWWAANSARSRRTALAAGILVAVLVAVSCVVWASPAARTVAHNAVSAGEKAISDAIPLTKQNTALKKEIAALKKQIWHEQGEMSAAQAAALSHQSQAASHLASLQQELITAQHELATASAASAAQSQSAATGVTHSVTTSGTGAPLVITAPTKAELMDPSTRYYGMYTPQSPFNYADLDATAVKVGVEPDLVGYFQGWDKNFRADAVTDAWSRGQLPLLTWESQPSDAGNNAPTQPAYNLPTILSGTYDGYIEQYAKAVVATGLPLVIRFDHEMNGDWYPWSENNGYGSSVNGNQPGDYAKTWQHVWNIFQAAGANQYVIWDWSPNIINHLAPAHKTLAYTQSLYPGDQYVDWVGLSGYLRPPYSSGQAFTFDYTFTASLNILRAITNKRIILSEVGASETGGHKPAWISSFFTSLAQPQNSDIIGFVWFDEAISTYIGGQLGTNDWRVDSRPSSLAAFIAGLTSPADHFTLKPAPPG